MAWLCKAFLAWPGLASSLKMSTAPRRDAHFQEIAFSTLAGFLHRFPFKNGTFFGLQTQIFLDWFGLVWPSGLAWPPLASLGLSLASPWPPLGLPLASFGCSLTSLGLSLAAFWRLCGLPLASLASLWPPAGLPLASLGPVLASLGLLLASLGVPWPPFGLPWASLGLSFGFLRLALASLASVGFP